jgi:glycosyltransferase involved in cell wall biosynthesis
LLSVAIICNQFPPEIDGVGDYTFQFAHALAKKNHQVYIFCRTGEDTIKGDVGIKIFAIIEDWDRANYRKISQTLKKLKPDVLFLQYVPYSFNRYGLPLQLIFALKAWKKQTSVATMFHEVRIRWQWQRPKSWFIASLQHLIAFGVHYLSHVNFTSIEFYQSYLLKPTFLMPIGSNIPRFTLDAVLLEQYRKEILPAAASPVLVCFGVRNFQLLAQSFTQVRAEYPQACLLVFGKGVQLTHQDGLICMGYTPAYELFHFLHLGDIFIAMDPVFNTGWGGTSNKSSALAAAMACGLPIIGMKGDMNNALLRHGENICLSEHQAGALAKAIIALHKDKNLRVKLGAHAQETYQKHLDWNVVADYFLYHLSPQS